MNKISIELLHNSGEFDSFSPVVWDGAKVIIASESAFNIKRIRSDLLSLKGKLSNDFSEFVQRKSNVDDLALNVEAQALNKNSVSDRVIALEEEVFPNITAQSRLNVRHSIAESTLYEQLSRTDKLKQVSSLIREGRLVKAIGRDISVNNSSGYMLEGKGSDGSLIRSENGVIEVQYYADKNTYHLTGGIPNVDVLTVAGDGIDLVVDDSKYVTVNLANDLVTGTNGIQVSSTNGVYTLNISPDFLTADAGGGLKVERAISGTFSVDFSDEVKAHLAQRYYAGYGIIITGKTISVDPLILPKFGGSTGLFVDRVSTNPDTYRISFDINSAGTPVKPVVTATAPINLAEFSESLETTEVVGLDKAYTDNIITQIIALENATLGLTNDVNYLLVDNFTDAFKLSYMCPILRLYAFMTGDYEKSGIVKATADPVDIKLLKMFGPKLVVLDMFENMLPYIAYSDMGSGTIMGIENDVNLFIPLENKLREILEDPTYVIPAAQKGTKFKIAKVDTSAMAYTAKPREELPEMNYNMEFALSALNSWGQPGHYSTLFGLAGCSAVPLSTFNSTKYAGMPLMITGGDADFISGKARVGQLNGTALAMPAGLSESVKLTIKTVTNVTTATDITYTMTINDIYTNADYNCKFKRLVGSKNIQPNVDYITELEGASNPGHIRAYGRLYTNWKLPDVDLNRILYFLGANNGCMANFASYMIYSGAIENKVWSKTYLRDVAYTAGIGFNITFDTSKIDYSTGMAKMSINLTSGSVGYSQFPIDLMMRDLRFGITYQFQLNAEDVYDVTQLFDPCCWGDFEALSALNCDVDDKEGDVASPHKPDPTLEYGKVADILRHN